MSGYRDDDDEDEDGAGGDSGAVITLMTPVCAMRSLQIENSNWRSPLDVENFCTTSEPKLSSILRDCHSLLFGRALSSYNFTTNFLLLRRS